MSCPIFISYSRKDLIKAEQIKKDVEDTTKQNCWFDIDGDIDPLFKVILLLYFVSLLNFRIFLLKKYF